MRAVIIDDEESVRESTQTLLAIYCPDVEIVGIASGVKSGIESIKTQMPDLVFLDVEMKDGTGFDVAYSFPHRDFSIIFITGHNEYALKALKCSAIDYLLKPVDPEELEKAVSKAHQVLKPELRQLQMKALEGNLEGKKLEKILLKDAEKVYLINVNEIIYCESDDNYTRFYIADERVILVSTTLKEYESLFSDLNFFRCHQSYLINLSYFDFLDKREGGSIKMKNGATLPVSVRKRDSLIKALESI